MNTTQSSTTHTGTAQTLDVRPLSGRIKHSTIFQWWFELPVGGSFILVNDHDPVPLRYQFQAEFAGAFTWNYLEQGPEAFRVLISKQRQVTPVAPKPPVQAGAVKTFEAAGVQDVDARGLEPPEPLVRILAALETLPAGMKLSARTDREPCHLFGEATQRGYAHVSIQQPDGSWITTLARA